MPVALLVLIITVATTVLPAGITRIGPGGRVHPPPAAAIGPTLSPFAERHRSPSSPAGQEGVRHEQPPPFRTRGRTTGPPLTAVAAREPVPVRFSWPLDGPSPVLRRFDPPPQPWLPGHRGVDLGAEPGSTVRAAGDGTVVFAGMVADHGVVSIEHPGGLRTTYQPVHIGIAAGRKTSAGTPLGTLATGHSGCPAAACLHWGLRHGSDYLDPLLLLALGRARLLPPAAGP
ncbi:murein hydrolase activator EnvC family protein [Catenuloplanes sp. NPDC051500]|uniref:murein hydrolase activator EnvC family protein n=1 Tax=Catenuloplanes sp. NPDC051500 TaxID=3363959 RepID=UPI0037AAB4AF